MIDPTILTILVSAIIYMEFKLEFPSMIFPTFIFNTELCWIQNSVILSTRYLSVFSIRTAQIKSYVPGQSTEFMSFPFIRFIWYIIFEKKKKRTLVFLLFAHIDVLSVVSSRITTITCRYNLHCDPLNVTTCSFLTRLDLTR